MKDASKRIDRMIGELENWKAILDDLKESYTAHIMIGMSIDRSHPDFNELTQRISHLDKAYDKAAKDLNSSFSNIRGYKLEAEITAKQVNKWREIVPDTEKMGDVASIDLTSGKARVFQAKSTSAHSNGEVNAHLSKAFLQLFGVNGEIPAPGAKLTIVIAIQSKKNLWPLLERNYTKGKIATKAQYLAKAKDKIVAAAKTALKEAKKLAVDANKRDRDHNIINENAYKMDQFLLRLPSSEIIVKIIYKKGPHVKVENDFLPVVRSKESDFSQFTAKLSAHESGSVSMTGVGFK